MQIIRRDERTGAPTLLFRVHVDRGISWDMAQGFLKQALLPPSPAAAAAAMDATMADAGGEGQALASPGDQAKSEQELKMGGKLMMAVDGKPSGRTLADDSTQHAPPQSSSADPMSDSVPSSSSPLPSPASDMLIDPASHLQQLECQTRLDSLQVAADAAPSQTDTGTDTLPQTSNSAQQLLSSDASNGIHPPADTATAPISQAQPLLALHHFDASDTAHRHEPPSHSFHSNLGSGSALGAVLADAPQAAPRSSPADEHATGPPSVSGYYRPARGAVRGVLLALETQGKGQVAVYRPATGPAARPMRLTELKDK